jgi:hypothetical protein
VSMRHPTVIVALVLLCVSACSHAPEPSLRSPTSGSSGALTTSPPSASHPRESVTAGPDPSFDLGQDIVVSPSGVAPAWLVARVGTPIVFRNETSGIVTVTFADVDASSGPIAAGGIWSYEYPSIISLTYRVTGAVDATGSIQVEDPYPRSSRGVMSPSA